MLASAADEFFDAVARLALVWGSLEPAQVYRVDTGGAEGGESGGGGGGEDEGQLELREVDRGLAGGRLASRAHDDG